MAKEKVEKKPVQHWKVLVDIFFVFCEKKFCEKPSFDGSAPRELKAIVLELEKRARFNSTEWTEELAGKMLNSFLEFAYMDKWLRQNFVLSNINRQKDKIFFAIKQKQISNPNHNIYQDQSLYLEMIRIYKLYFKSYITEELVDMPACVDMAFFVADANGWDKKTLLTEKLTELLNQWEYIVSYISSDIWFSSRVLSEIRNDWQKLIQKINATNNARKKRATGSEVSSANLYKKIFGVPN